MKKLASLLLDEEGRSMALPEGNSKGFCMFKEKGLVQLAGQQRHLWTRIFT